jgi:hypothetical protein
MAQYGKNMHRAGPGGNRLKGGKPRAGRGAIGLNSAMEGGKYSRTSFRLTNPNSAMTPVADMQRGIRGRALPSKILNARSSTPTSILNGGKQSFGPLTWSDPGKSAQYRGKGNTRGES